MEIVIEIQLKDGELFSITLKDGSDEEMQRFSDELEKHITTVNDIKTFKMVCDGFEMFDDEEDCARRIAAFSDKWRN